MRSVRCEACGTKALMAASQCPKCSHLFDMRDGFGELLPLSFCSSCQSYYPATVGSCKWCGTLPEPVRKPLPWTHIGVGGLIAMAWLGGVLLRDPRGKSHARSSAQARARSQTKKSAADDSVLQVVASSLSDTLVSPDTATRRDTVAPRDTIAAWTNIDPSTPPPAPTPAPATEVPTVVAPDRSVVQSGARVTRVSTTPGSPIVSRPAVATGPSVAGTPAVYPATPTVYPATPTVYPPPSRDYSTAPVASRSQPYVPQVKARASSRSVIFVAKNWIVVRAEPSQDAHIVASVGPEARVQLGEVRGSWRRIHSRDIVGWVDMRRANFAEARGSTRANGFAVR